MKLIAFEHRQADSILRSFAHENGTEGLVPRAGEVDYVGNLEKMANAMSPRARLGVRLAVWIVALAPIWLGISLSTMAGISLERRAAILDKMLVSDSFLVRELSFVMKIGASFALFATKSIRSRSQYYPAGTQEEEPSERPTPKPARAVALPMLRPSQTGAR